MKLQCIKEQIPCLAVIIVTVPNLLICGEAGFGPRNFISPLPHDSN